MINTTCEASSCEGSSVGQESRRLEWADHPPYCSCKLITVTMMILTNYYFKTHSVWAYQRLPTSHIIFVTLKMSKKTKLLNTKMLYYFMERVTVSISNESFITFIQPAVMPSPPQTPALHKKTIGDSAG